MYSRVIQLVVGTGSGQEVVNRIDSDLLPIYADASGFLAYYVIAAGGDADDTFVTIRVFEDEVALEDADVAAADATEQIGVDFDLSFTHQGEGEVALFGQPSEF